MVLSLAYVGTQGHRLIAQTEVQPRQSGFVSEPARRWRDARTPECGPNGELGVYTRPDGSIVNGTRGPLGPNFGSNGYTANIANSNYNSFQISVERKAADLTFLAAYTYAKAMDNSSGFGQWINFTNYRLSRALSHSISPTISC